MLRTLCLMIFLFCVGCFENSDSSMLGAGVTINPGDSDAFISAKIVFAGSCGGGACHSEFASYTESQFVADGLLVPGDVDGSSIYCRLQGSTGSCGTKNMPLNQSALSSTDLQAIADWISGATP